MTQNIVVSLPDSVTLSLSDQGTGRPVLLLHGGAGPRSVLAFGAALAATGARVLIPTHPGFMGTPRPDWCDRVSDIALVYADLLAHLDLRDVLVIGNSLGGWVASELALREPARVGRIVLLNAAGIEVEGHPVAQLAGLSPAQIAALAYCEPARFAIDPSTLGPEALAALAANRAAMAAYANEPYMHDPKLRRRLRRVTQPALVVWGERDQVVDLAYGRAYADAFAHGTFAPMAGAAHFPQLEQPERLLALVSELMAAPPAARTGS